METPTINIINLNSRPDKRDHIISEFKRHNITNYQFWAGVTFDPTFTAISRAHKQIIRYAKQQGLKSVTIAEDDCVFSDYGAWQYYLNNMPKDFDIYLSSIYWGVINEYNIVEDFSGFTLYTVHERYYDTFLAINENGHIDRSQCERRERMNDSPILIPRGKFVVCPLFTTFQVEGFSNNSMTQVSYNEKYLGFRKFYSSTQPYFTWQGVYARSIAENNALMATSS